VAEGKLSFSIKSEYDQGALCYLPQPANRKRATISTQLYEYVKANIEKWHHYVNNSPKGVKLKLEEIVVITGTVTSPECFLAAVSTSSKSRSVGAEATFLSLAKLGVQFDYSTHSQIPVRTHNATKSSGKINLNRDLDLFLSYYKMKRLFRFLKKLEANAGPHTLPDEEDEYGDTVVLVDEYGNDADAGWPQVSACNDWSECLHRV
jgi:hypothetical protein